MVAFAWTLLAAWAKEKRVELDSVHVEIDPEALRLVAYADWSDGNYRSLARFAETVVAQESKGNRQGSHDDPVRLAVRSILERLKADGRLG